MGFDAGTFLAGLYVPLTNESRLVVAENAHAVPCRTTIKKVAANKTARRLIGNGFPPVPPSIPPPSILAKPKVICPRCGVRPVLAELLKMTSGCCWECSWTKSHVRILSLLG